MTTPCLPQTYEKEAGAPLPLVGTRPLHDILPNGTNMLHPQPSQPDMQQPSMLQHSLNNIFGAKTALANRFTGLSQFQDPTSTLNPKGKQPYSDIVEFIPGSIIEKE